MGKEKEKDKNAKYQREIAKVYNVDFTNPIFEVCVVKPKMLKDDAVLKFLTNDNVDLVCCENSVSRGLQKKTFFTTFPACHSSPEILVAPEVDRVMERIYELMEDRGTTGGFS